MSLKVQIFLWALLDDLLVNPLVDADYLQVFELLGQGVSQKIIHSQEVPEYQKVYQFDNVINPLNSKLYIIDNSTYVTMLLCDEY